MKYNKTLKVGDILEMNHGIAPQIVISLGNDITRIDVWPVDDVLNKNKASIGVPMSWVKRKMKLTTKKTLV